MYIPRCIHNVTASVSTPYVVICSGINFCLLTQKKKTIKTKYFELKRYYNKLIAFSRMCINVEIGERVGTPEG